MNYAPIQRISTARHIARSAQTIIRNATGIALNLILCPTDNTFKTPERMLEVVAIALDMSPLCFRMKTHIREVVELRYIAAILLRRHFPRITLQQVGILFGGMDHTSIMSGITRANNLLATCDERFMAKYNTVLNSVNIWLAKEAA